MFIPHCCPNHICPEHSDPMPDFFLRHGSYNPKCRPHPVPRFICKTCKRSFSRQTFRADYCDNKPHLNAELFMLVASGIGIRQSSRKTGLSLRCTELKLRKIGRHLRRLNLNLQGQLESEARLHFHELETYEGQRNTRPLSVPVLIETDSRFIIWAESAPIRPRGKMTKKRLNAIKESEIQHGTRKDLSMRSVKRTLQRGADLLNNSLKVIFYTDEKSSYPSAATTKIGKHRLVHLQTNSKLVRATFNPLFRINHEEVVMRDLMGRLRRESWLVSKKRRYLDIALQVHIAYRNLVRRRFNKDEGSPAQLLGFLPRRLKPTEVLSWRQDWRERSIHPLSKVGDTVDCWK
ncbi:MAG: transposase-like protein [Planctomycetota bacterium]|jgi:transposase-like protein